MSRLASSKSVKQRILAQSEQLSSAEPNPNTPSSTSVTSLPLLVEDGSNNRAEDTKVAASAPSEKTSINNVRVRNSRKITLPCFTFSEVCDATDDGAVRIAIPIGVSDSAYYERPKLTDKGQRVHGKPMWKRSQFNLFPIVLDATSLPWPEANNYILSRLEDTLAPRMSTYDGIASDLAAYRRFLDDEVIDWRLFPQQKLGRPTYRYSGYLGSAIAAGTIAATSAKRRMASIIGFYKWMKIEGVMVPAYEPWREKDVYIKVTGTYGTTFNKHVTTTDISIKVPKQDDPYDGRINDGGRLRPLSEEEQRWVAEALFAQGNTEMILIHLFSLLTGARIQTVLTSQVRHVHAMTALQSKRHSTTIRIPVGPGTGIDTKGDKQMSLHIPVWFYQMLLTYVDSDRAHHRRTLAKGGDTENQYLFLSRYGTPFYKSKADSLIFDNNSKLRQPIKGQSVRKFIEEAIIPYIQRKYDVTFRYQFHDLRASFGMNLTDSQLILVTQGKRTLSQVREFVKTRMGHTSAATTDRYLQFRGNLTHVLQVLDDHDEHLRNLVEKAGLI